MFPPSFFRRAKGAITSALSVTDTLTVLNEGIELFDNDSTHITGDLQEKVADLMLHIEENSLQHKREDIRLKSSTLYLKFMTIIPERTPEENVVASLIDTVLLTIPNLHKRKAKLILARQELFEAYVEAAPYRFFFDADGDDCALTAYEESGVFEPSIEDFESMDRRFFACKTIEIIFISIAKHARILPGSLLTIYFSLCTELLTQIELTYKHDTVINAFATHAYEERTLVTVLLSGLLTEYVDAPIVNAIFGKKLRTADPNVLISFTTRLLREHKPLFYAISVSFDSYMSDFAFLNADEDSEYFQIILLFKQLYLLNPSIVSRHLPQLNRMVHTNTIRQLLFEIALSAGDVSLVDGLHEQLALVNDDEIRCHYLSFAGSILLGADVVLTNTELVDFEVKRPKTVKKSAQDLYEALHDESARVRGHVVTQLAFVLPHVDYLREETLSRLIERLDDRVQSVRSATNAALIILAEKFSFDDLPSFSLVFTTLFNINHSKVSFERIAEIHDMLLSYPASEYEHFLFLVHKSIEEDSGLFSVMSKTLQIMGAALEGREVPRIALPNSIFKQINELVQLENADEETLSANALAAKVAIENKSLLPSAFVEYVIKVIAETDTYGEITNTIKCLTVLKCLGTGYFTCHGTDTAEVKQVLAHLLELIITQQGSDISAYETEHLSLLDALMTVGGAFSISITDEQHDMLSSVLIGKIMLIEFGIDSTVPVETNITQLFFYDIPIIRSITSLLFSSETLVPGNDVNQMFSNEMAAVLNECKSIISSDEQRMLHKIVCMNTLIEMGKLYDPFLETTLLTDCIRSAMHFLMSREYPIFSVNDDITSDNDGVLHILYGVAIFRLLQCLITRSVDFDRTLIPALARFLEFGSVREVSDDEFSDDVWGVCVRMFSMRLLLAMMANKADLRMIVTDAKIIRSIVYTFVDQVFEVRYFAYTEAVRYQHQILRCFLLFGLFDSHETIRLFCYRRVHAYVSVQLVKGSVSSNPSNLFEPLLFYLSLHQDIIAEFAPNAKPVFFPVLCNGLYDCLFSRKKADAITYGLLKKHIKLALTEQRLVCGEEPVLPVLVNAFDMYLDAYVAEKAKHCTTRVSGANAKIIDDFVPKHLFFHPTEDAMTKSNQTHPLLEYHSLNHASKGKNNVKIIHEIHKRESSKRRKQDMKGMKEQRTEMHSDDEIHMADDEASEEMIESE
ncbi:hypothetical protein PCE1_002930 [Barthelona sp. PCE]